ncbi:LOW QUALITY PROTEIN: vitamin K-dependent protein Z-like [Coregonus clupeaformis]|uniref:LOW QUALITY PROTEIN: vitamin K-dependent protein Z-like n=1 Tax=Coregonus clupeaformis TaxID=59861 RepID=UPI001E1C9A6C|nr:LOW QUALITY PROTEIN: vitamin K-dependent protein Z-like [Coregonus clupeaformis]
MCIIMGSWRRWWFLSLSLLSSVLLVHSYGRVFRPPAHASTVFLRSSEPNVFFLEEMLQGNLERECYEESCNYEEAREYFEDTPKTDTFWNVYVDGDQCKPNPCLHGGSCKDWRWSCINLSAPPKGPFSCDHFCSPKFEAYQCSCTTGYKIHSDKRSCIPAVKHPCGRLQPTNQINIAYHVCPHNRCPWQVVFVDEAGAELCSGVILGPHAVLTSASCLYMGKKLHSMQTGASNNM